MKTSNKEAEELIFKKHSQIVTEKEIVIFDIETGTSPDADKFVPEFKEPKLRKDGQPYANSKTIEEQREQWSEKCPLDALTAEVLAIGTYDGKSMNIVHNIEMGEPAMLVYFWALYSKWLEQGKTIVGFNIRNFDLPMLVRRSWRHRLQNIPYKRDENWRWNTHLFDLSEVWRYGEWGDRYISLDNLSTYFDFGGKGSGKGFEQLYKNPETIEKAIKYINSELKDIYRIAKIML